jgi:predicted DNA-binding protein (MmcQ/YjbR family)
MDIEIIRNICNALPSVKEDIKWGNDLCFMIKKKLFCVIPLEFPLKISLKVADEEFEEISCRDGIIPAPYVARSKWILVENINLFDAGKWEHYITQSYNLVMGNLSGKTLAVS